MTLSRIKHGESGNYLWSVDDEIYRTTDHRSIMLYRKCRDNSHHTNPVRIWTGPWLGRACSATRNPLTTSLNAWLALEINVCRNMSSSWRHTRHSATCGASAFGAYKFSCNLRSATNLARAVAQRLWASETGSWVENFRALWKYKHYGMIMNAL